MLYCAFVISSMLDDWSGIAIDRAVAYIRKCYVSRLRSFLYLLFDIFRATKEDTDKHQMGRHSVSTQVALHPAEPKYRLQEGPRTAPLPHCISLQRLKVRH